jgi:hypothetical protein
MPDTGEKEDAETKGQKLRPVGRVVNLKIKNFLFDITSVILHGFAEYSREGTM